LSHYYCHECAFKLGFIGTIPSTINVLGSTYQVDKFIKHTIPSTIHNFASIFTDPSTLTYQGYVVNAHASGSYEIDDSGRGNIILVAGPSVGAAYNKGTFVAPQDAVRIVLSSDPLRLHAFPVYSTNLSSVACENCSNPIIKV
jgi:hypothetical protein